MKRLIETVREHAGTRSIVGSIPKADVRALCNFAESLCGNAPHEIGSNEFDRWARDTMPGMMEKSVVVTALSDTTSVVRIIFELGRHYERLVKTKEATT